MTTIRSLTPTPSPAHPAAPRPDPRIPLAEMIAERAYRLLQKYVQLAPGRPAFYALPRGDRLLLIFDPAAIRDAALPLVP